MIHSIALFDEAVLYRDPETADIIVERGSLPANIEIGEEVHVNNEEKIYSYTIKHCDEENDVVTLKYNEEVLTEAPVITLSDSERNNPDSISLKNIVARKEAEEEQAKAQAAEEAKKEELAEKYSDIIENFRQSFERHDPILDTLDIVFNGMVPDRGSCETVAGELVRATMRLLYRDYNDGDKFFEGYGLETCGSSAEYLHDQGVEVIDDMLKHSYELSVDDEAYTSGLLAVAEDVINKLYLDTSLFTELNKEDSRNYNVNYVSGFQPEYDLTIYASEDLSTLIENNIVSSDDAISYIQDIMDDCSLDFNNAEIETPWARDLTEYTITGLNKTAYDYLHDLSIHEDKFWSDFVEQFEDELDRIEEDEDSEDYVDDLEDEE